MACVALERPHLKATLARRNLGQTHPVLAGGTRGPICNAHGPDPCTNRNDPSFRFIARKNAPPTLVNKSHGTLTASNFSPGVQRFSMITFPLTIATVRSPSDISVARCMSHLASAVFRRAAGVR